MLITGPWRQRQEGQLEQGCSVSRNKHQLSTDIDALKVLALSHMTCKKPGMYRMSVFSSLHDERMSQGICGGVQGSLLRVQWISINIVSMLNFTR